MVAGRAPVKAVLKRRGSGLKKTKSGRGVVFGNEVRDYQLDTQRSNDYAKPNHGDLVETRAHNYKVKLEAKKFDVEQLEAVIDTCTKEREEVLASVPSGGCCGLSREGQIADRRAYDLEMRIMQAENDLGKERDQLADIDARFQAQVDLLVARMAAALAADIDENEFYESPRTSDTAGPGPHVSSPVELEDIWEGEDDAVQDEAGIRAPSVPLDKTEEGIRAHDIILRRMSTTGHAQHPQPTLARLSSTSGGGSFKGPRTSGVTTGALVRRQSGKANSGEKKPFEAREGERWPAERPWEVEGQDVERRHSGKKRVSGTQKLYSRASGGHSTRSLAASGSGSHTGNDLPPVSPNKVPGPPLKKLSIMDAVKALEAARDKANALDSTPLDDSGMDPSFAPLLAPRMLERHPSKLKLKMPPPELDELEDIVEATAGHTPGPRHSFIGNPFLKSPTARLSFAGAPGGGNARPPMARSSFAGGTTAGGPKPPGARASFGRMGSVVAGMLSRNSAMGPGGAQSPIAEEGGDAPSGARKWQGNSGKKEVPKGIPEEGSVVGGGKQAAAK